MAWAKTIQAEGQDLYNDIGLAIAQAINWIQSRWAQGIQTDKQTTASDGTLTWTYPNAYGSGVVPNVQAVVQAAAGSTDVLNVQLDGAPTNTQAKLRVTRTQQSVVALLGLTILSIPAAIGAQLVHLRAET